MIPKNKCGIEGAHEAHTYTAHCGGECSECHGTGYVYESTYRDYGNGYGSSSHTSRRCTKGCPASITMNSGVSL